MGLWFQDLRRLAKFGTWEICWSAIGGGIQLITAIVLDCISWCLNAHCQFYPLVSKITFVLYGWYMDYIWMIYGLYINPPGLVFLSYFWCSTRDDDLLWRSCVWNVSRNDQLETVGSWNIDQRKKNVTGWWFGTMEFYNFPFSWEFHQLTNSYFSEG